MLLEADTAESSAVAIESNPSKSLFGGSVSVVLVVVVGIALVTVQFRVEADLANVILLTVGGMHVFFDGFIWKLRRPVVARSVAAA